MAILVAERTPESIDVSADWLNRRAVSLRKNGQNLTADMCERKAHRLFIEANELRKKRRGEAA